MNLAVAPAVAPPAAGVLAIARTRFFYSPAAGLITAMVLALLAWLGWRFWENSLGHQTIGLKIGAVFAPAGIAGLVYWLGALAFKIPAAKEMTEFALARFKR